MLRIQLLTSNQQLLTAEMCGVISGAAKSGDLDDAVEHLYVLMESKGKAMDLIKYAIEQEVEAQKEVATLFRLNSLGSKLLKVYTAKCGQEFLTACVGQGLARAKALPEALEIDPAKVAPDVVERNVPKLEAECEAMLNDIVNALRVAPRSMRIICNHISQCVASKFKDDRVRPLGIGAYVFLRMIGPALIGSDRTVMLISKVIQNLANQVQFGKKEAFMVPLNRIVKAQQERVNTFLLEMAQVEGSLEVGQLGEESFSEARLLQAVAALTSLASTANQSKPPCFQEAHVFPLSMQRSALLTALLKQLHSPDASLDLFFESKCLLGVAMFIADASIANQLLDVYRVPSEIEEVTEGITSEVGVARCAPFVKEVLSLYGKDFLKASLAKVLHPVVQGNLRYEVEPSRLRSVDNATSNAEELLALTKSFTEALFTSMLNMPTMLWAAVSATGSVGAALVDGVLGPALADPREYWLSVRALKPEAERTFELLASLLRFLFVGDKRTDFPPLVCKFVEMNGAKTRQFLNEWGTLKPRANAPGVVPSLRKPDVASFRAAMKSVVLLKGVQEGIPVRVCMADVLK